MSDGLDDLFAALDSDSSNPGQGGGSKLRKQLEDVLAQNKALTEQLAQVQTQQRESSLAGLFAKHSIPALAADFFPKDGELTDESATAFIEKYGQLWGATAAPATTPPAAQAATNAAQAFAAQAQPGTVAPLSEEAYRAKFAEATTKDEFLKMLAEAEAAYGG
jgi:hypothetical protein